MADYTPEFHHSLPSGTRVRWKDMGDGTHALVYATEANLNVEDTEVSSTHPVPTEEIVRTENAWTILMNDQVFDNIVSTANSISHDITGYGALWVHIFVISAGAPTDVRVIAQFSHDNGTTWFCFEEGLWASLYWEDTDTATPGVYKVYLLPCGGQDLVQFRVVATGVGVGATFTVRIIVRAFYGNFGVAHA